ncbi:MAG: NPCBM/NEW2 domain-containing protein [Planctomycetota bacterium]|nr:NPCBM/NEW2 domain-containing protein [Planctomycetaceae bacterium]MDQ3329167.1 NPCBM/NEW2 domain-containing protein [Planctomycetota bacterium]
MTTAAVLMIALAATTSAKVSTLDGKSLDGKVASIDAKTLTLESEGRTSPVPLDSILEISFDGASQPSGETTDGQVTVRLSDGSRLTCRQTTMEGRTLVADSLAAGRLQLPWNAVQAIRFRPTDPAVESKWSELVASAPERDLLVVRNRDVLDRLEGTVSGLDEANLVFLVGETRVPIDRSKPKLFGVVPGRAQPSKSTPLCELRFRNGDRLALAGVEMKGDSLTLKPAAGGTTTVHLDAVASIDFGQGKVTSLSQLEPREKKHAPYFGSELDSVFDVRIDHSDAGPQVPIRIDGQTFQRGLVIHSQTRLNYRLNGDYRRFVAVAGIEQLVRPRGRVTLTITADGKELFAREVKGSDSPIPLDLDVTGARELTIFVDFGGDLDDGDHLALGDARLIK